MTSQQSAIYSHLLKCGTITHLEAVKLYCITGFLARISELRAKGHAISDRWAVNPTTGAKYKVYYLEREQGATR